MKALLLSALLLLVGTVPETNVANDNHLFRMNNSAGAYSRLATVVAPATYSADNNVDVREDCYLSSVYKVYSFISLIHISESTRGIMFKNSLNKNIE
jgi:hypothetical protein